MTKDNSGAAFPSNIKWNSAASATLVGGLTKREWFAGMALQGILASGPVLSGNVIDHTLGISKASFALADAILKAGEE